MTIWNYGSINIDHVYRLPHLPAPGETIAALGLTQGLGGKGANQSVAAARAGSRVRHIGAIGQGGEWARARMEELGVDVRHVASLGMPGGHAIINVDDEGENAIVIVPGANRALSEPDLAAALAEAAPGDLMLLQNETSLQPEAAALARAKGLRVIYSAAPFEAAAVRAMLPHAAILVMNAGEAEALVAELSTPLAELPVEAVLVTMGGAGASYHDLRAGHLLAVPAFPVAAVDTTGAGDTFTGCFAAGLDQGLSPEEAMRLGAAAAALKVTRAGAADAIPTRAEIDAFLRSQAG